MFQSVCGSVCIKVHVDMCVYACVHENEREDAQHIYAEIHFPAFLLSQCEYSGNDSQKTRIPELSLAHGGFYRYRLRQTFSFSLLTFNQFRPLFFRSHTL